MTAESPDTSRAPAPESWISLGRHTRPLMATTIVALVALALFLWWRGGRETTDNAHVQGSVHPIAARLDGTVAEVLVSENQFVEAGVTLFTLDPRDAEIALQRARADLAAAEARLAAASSELPIVSAVSASEVAASHAELEQAGAGIELYHQRVEEADADVAAAVARLERMRARTESAKRDNTRITTLHARNRVSDKERDDAQSLERSTQAAQLEAEAAVRAASSRAEISRRQLIQATEERTKAKAGVAAAAVAPQRVAFAESEVETARARVQQAKAAIARAALDLEYTTITAPVAGVVSRKSVEVGQAVTAGRPVLAVVALHDVWIEANYKETQLANLRVGQPVRIHVDAFRGTLAGTVDSIGAATGSRFSLLPAENATGNFVKVVQRVPVKISLDEPPPAERPLRPGMSVVTTVLTRRARASE